MAGRSFWTLVREIYSREHPLFIRGLTGSPRSTYSTYMGQGHSECVEVLRDLVENSACPYDGRCREFTERCPYHRAVNFLERQENPVP